MDVLRRYTLLFALALLVSCGRQQPAAESPEHDTGSPDQLLVYAVNAPLAWMAREIGGEMVTVRMPVPDGVDPAYWQPGPEAILPWLEADLILLNGAGYAKWLAYASLPGDRMVDTSAQLSDQLITMQGSLPHSHGPQGEHSHGVQAFTLWLDLSQAAVQAKAVYQAMLQRMPDHHAVLSANFQSVAQNLSELDSAMGRAVEPLLGRTIIYSHPVYQYFARRYQLPGVSLHWEADAEPAAEEWRELEAMLEDAKPALMIWEAEPLPAVRQRLHRLGIDLAVVEPGAGAADKDFAALMEENIKRLLVALDG